MPTNLKSLLSRSRSRNELKSRGTEESPSADTTTGSNNDAKDVGTTTHTAGSVCKSCCVRNEETLTQQHQHNSHCFDQFLHCDTFTTRNAADVVGMRSSGGSCSHLVSSYSDWTNVSHGTGVGNDFLSIKSPKSSVQDIDEHNSRPGVAMRKCETVITLSTFTGNGPQQQTVGGSSIGSCGAEHHSSISGSSGPGTHNGGSGASEKAKVMKNKILSTSSSTLNCLLHSSSRSKLFSSWKLSSGSNSGGSDYPEFVASITPSSKVRGSFNETADVQQIFKSQLSIPESGVGTVPMTPLNRLRNNFYAGGAQSTYSRSSSVASFGWKDVDDFSSEILCRLCLCNVKNEDTMDISACCCRYCKDCITAYVNFEIQEGAEEIACPDASCEKQGVISLSELEILVSPSMMEKHKKFRLYREVEKDGHLMWCPTPACETICRIQESNLDVRVDGKSHKSLGISTNKSLTINCTTCHLIFCAECKLSCHPGISCEAFRRKLIKQGKLSVDDEELFALDCIKKCPFCHVPIEKDSGCAQMMCKKCKHVFCWYCLASLDDDFLLRHYDKGPCKNKLGHSRASVVWHRAQVIGIFAGFGVLVLLASPLLILAAPCLLCCRCRYCAKDSEDSPVQV